MKMLQALKNWLRGVDEKGAEALQDDERDARFAIEDAQRQVERFRGKIADLMAQTRDLTRKCDAAQKDVEKFEGFAQKAAAAQKEDDLREALGLKAEAQRKADAMNTQIAANEELEHKMRQELADALDLIAHSENTQVSLAARDEAAKIRESLMQAASDFSGGGGLAALRDLEKRVTKKEDVLAAKEQLLVESPIGKTKALEKRYGAQGIDMDAEVARYMQAAAPPAQPPKAAGGKK